MSATIAALILVFLCSIICSVLYWQIIHPVLLKHIRFNLFSVRDAARSIAAEKGLGNDPRYQNLEGFICNTIFVGPQINLFSFIRFVSRYRRALMEENKEMAKDDDFNGLPAEFSSFRDTTSRDAFCMMMLNSPWLLIFVLVPAPILWAVGKLSRIIIYRNAENFVSTISSSSGYSIEI